MFVTGDIKGSVSLWKDKKVVLYTDVCTEPTLVIATNDTVFATSAYDGIVEMSSGDGIVDLWRTNTHGDSSKRPVVMDANEKYLVVGYEEQPLYEEARTTIDVRKGHKTIYNNGHRCPVAQVKFCIKID